MNIKHIQKLNSEIENFRACYDGNELWGQRDNHVAVDVLIEYLIEHPEFAQIAESIRKLSKEVK